jgi:hypothetical protein
MIAQANSTRNQAAAKPTSPTVKSSWRLMRRFVVWMLAGVGVGLLIVLVIARQSNYDPTPTLTPQLFHSAHERWKKTETRNYDIEVRVTGPQAAVYRVQVRDGEPIAAWRNGDPLKTRRTFGTWSIGGMFATISRDIEALERSSAAGRQTPLILRAAFHPEYHYPEHYRRIDNGSRKGSDSIAVTWDVTEFRVVESKE